MAARQRPFGAGCKVRALRGHGERWDGVTQIVKNFNYHDILKHAYLCQKLELGALLRAMFIF